MTELVLQRLERIEQQLEQLLSAKVHQEWYDTKTVAEILGKSHYCVREWCRNRRCRAQKRAVGRGSAKEWMISHEELQRIKSEGLLPLSRGF
ncbi:MAG: helix-turn-helix domain-containing protein [Planctomycetales bacterium]|nr:helix-turn-helix domain-containing protein [Planctomycetales bacterium]